jgi:hypothetical protein
MQQLILWCESDDRMASKLERDRARKAAIQIKAREVVHARQVPVKLQSDSRRTEQQGMVVIALIEEVGDLAVLMRVAKGSEQQAGPS